MGMKSDWETGYGDGGGKKWSFAGKSTTIERNKQGQKERYNGH